MYNCIAEQCCTLTRADLPLILWYISVYALFANAAMFVSGHSSYAVLNETNKHSTTLQPKQTM
jgi:hypothetical protein